MKACSLVLPKQVQVGGGRLAGRPNPAAVGSVKPPGATSASLFTRFLCGSRAAAAELSRRDRLCAPGSLEHLLSGPLQTRSDGPWSGEAFALGLVEPCASGAASPGLLRPKSGCSVRSLSDSWGRGGSQPDPVLAVVHLASWSLGLLHPAPRRGRGAQGDFFFVLGVFY